MGLINWQYVINAGLFSGLGIVIFIIGFVIIDLITPYKIWNELVEKHNIALAIVVGSVAIGISQIIASAIHG